MIQPQGRVCDSVILRPSWLDYMMGLDRNLPARLRMGGKRVQEAREKELTEG